MLRKNASIVLLSMSVVVCLSGCLKGEQSLQEVEIPEEITVVEENIDTLEDVKTKDDQLIIEEKELAEETVSRELYLFDRNGLVVPQLFELPKTESAAAQVLEYLVVDGPISDLLPNGFQAVIPAGTEILGVNLTEDGTLIVDFSEEFTQYEPENERKILQAITYSLTQFEHVERIKIWLNGENLEEMPIKGTPIASGVSKANGINVQLAERPDVAQSKSITVYYPKTFHDEHYFVPVTEYINLVDENLFASIIETLIEGPAYEVQAMQVFNDDTELISSPRLENGVLELQFNEEILSDKDESVISSEVIESIVRTLTEHDDVDAVELKVEHRSSIVDENGNSYNHPVSKDDVTRSMKL